MTRFAASVTGDVLPTRNGMGIWVAVDLPPHILLQIDLHIKQLFMAAGDTVAENDEAEHDRAESFIFSTILSTAENLAKHYPYPAVDQYLADLNHQLKDELHGDQG